MLIFIAAFIIPCIISYVLTPLVTAFAHSVGIMDYPEEDKIHKNPTPRFGGLAIYIACAAAVAILYNLQPDLMCASGREYIGMTIASLIILSIGIYDDICGASATVKFTGQIAASLVLMKYGFVIKAIATPFDSPVELGLFAFPLTVLWLVGVCNSINLIDGLDGLAGGVALIASLSFFSLGLYQNLLVVAVLSTVVAGSVVGFLRYNLHPAKTFMGDTGSLFLGFALATISIWPGSGNLFSISGLTPAVVLAIPLSDTAMAIYRRTMNRAHIFRSDTGHLHHRLMDLGFSQRRIVFLICLLSTQLGLLSFAYVVTQTERLSTVVLAFVGITLFCAFAALKFAERQRSTPRESYDIETMMVLRDQAEQVETDTSRGAELVGR